MLFNSFEFLLFLAAVLLVFLGLRKKYYKLTIAWLVFSSLFFYGWWNPIYLLLIIGSMIINFCLGYIIDCNQGLKAKIILVCGIIGNLALLVYFKYANFFVDSLSYVTSLNLELAPIALPLAISFFTFQQIAYLVDVYRAQVHEHNVLQYSLFVIFFPQLIAGPIVHHKEMMPQFSTNKITEWHQHYLAVGMAIFTLGLFKKVMIADEVAQYAIPVFNAADLGQPISQAEAWTAMFAYSFQLYFDFSGYTDMAVGTAYLFGILLPMNFNSPYKARNIIEFWRHWHMTLSRFLRDYLYIPLGGNRYGKIYRYRNLLLTMLLGGLWHGAGWTFLLWGGVHGVYLIINHAWRSILYRLNLTFIYKNRFYQFFSMSLTFLVVAFAWVLFRSPDVQAALYFYNALLSSEQQGFNVMSNSGVIWCVVLLLFCWLAPNVQQICGNITYQGWWQWSPSFKWAGVLSILLFVSILNINKFSEFIYFQF